MTVTMTGVGCSVAQVRERLTQVIVRHKRGEVDAAIAGYREVLAITPRQFDALRLLAVALHSKGNAAQALEVFDQALAVRSDFAEVWFLRGETLAQMGRMEEAANSIDRALALDHGQPGWWTRLGEIRHGLQQYRFALDAAEHVAKLAPRWAPAWTNRALALDALRRPQEALSSYERALALDPQAADAWCGRAKALNDLRRCEEALECVARSLAIDPAYLHAHNCKAAALRSLGRLEESLAAADAALAHDSNYPSGWAQRGCTLAALCQLEEAKSCLQRAVALAPHDRQASFNLGVVRLTLGELEAGWDGYEDRAHASGTQGASVSTGLPGVPVWQRGQDPRGKRIALLCEQGLGDAIQFCRYAPRLAQRGARVTLIVPPSLVRILQDLGEGIEVVAEGSAIAVPDLQCALLSLPHRFGTTLASIPAQVPYLRAPDEQVQAWQRKLEGSTRRQNGTPPLRVGIAFRGNAGHHNDRNRSIPMERLGALLAASDATGVEWHCLQQHVRDDDLAWLKRLAVTEHRAELADMADTAALIRCMDAVVSVDTAVAHLAGALGVTLFLLLPWHPDWRWMVERPDSPWYPDARLFRQSTLGAWDEPLREASLALAQYLATGVAQHSCR